MLVGWERRPGTVSITMTEKALNSKGATCMSTRPIRMLIAKPGLDGHDRGAKVMARAFRDAGFEVVYTGLFQTPEMIAVAAMQEDVDVVGLSILSGAHMTLFPLIMGELNSHGVGDVVVVAGGTIPEVDIDSIHKMGVAAVFGPGTSMSNAIDSVQYLVAEQRRHAPQ